MRKGVKKVEPKTVYLFSLLETYRVRSTFLKG